MKNSHRLYNNKHYKKGGALDEHGMSQSNCCMFMRGILFFNERRRENEVF